MAVDDVYTISLLHMNGADASTTFTDESGKSWTANADAQIDTAQSVFDGASGLFDGTGDYISSADSPDWQLDGGSNSNSWTWEARIRFNGDPGTGHQGFIQQRVDNNNYWSIALNNNVLFFQIRSASVNLVLIQNAWDPVTATWYHVAVVKSGTAGYMMFVDGTQIGSTATDTDTMPDFSGSVTIGLEIGSGGVSNYFNGWMDEVRISKGIARWTSNFTPPAYPYAPGGGFFF